MKFPKTNYTNPSAAPQKIKVSTAVHDKSKNVVFPNNVFIYGLCLALAVAAFLAFVCAKAVDQILFGEEYTYQINISETVTDDLSPSAQLSVSDRKLTGNVVVRSDVTLYKIEDGATIVPLGSSLEIIPEVQNDAAGVRIYVVKHAKSYSLPNGAEWELPLILEAGNDYTTMELLTDRFSTMDEGYYSFHVVCDNYADEVWSECVLFLDMSRIAPGVISTATYTPATGSIASDGSVSAEIEDAVQTTMLTSNQPIFISEHFAEIEVVEEVSANNREEETVVSSEPVYLGMTEEGTDMWELPSDSLAETSFFFVPHMFGGTVVAEG